jgi:hypothetical protein
MLEFGLVAPHSGFDRFAVGFFPAGSLLREHWVGLEATQDS